jgi:hypothetical protein
MDIDMYSLQVYRTNFTERSNLCKCFADIAPVIDLSRVCGGVSRHRIVRFVPYHALPLDGKYRD